MLRKDFELILSKLGLFGNERKKNTKKISRGLLLKGSVFCLDLVHLDIFIFDELKQSQ